MLDDKALVAAQAIEDDGDDGNGRPRRQIWNENSGDDAAW